MDEKIKSKWVTALRSGEYKQGSGSLVEVYDGVPEAYCCLGVLCEVLGLERDGHEYKVPVVEGHESEISGGEEFLYCAVDISEGYAGRLGLRELVEPENYDEPEEIQSVLISMNDDGVDFGRIADYIEERL